MAKLPLDHGINSGLLHRRILDSRTGLLFWQWREAQVGLDDLHLREQALRLLAFDARMYDHIITYTKKGKRMLSSTHRIRTVKNLPGTQLIGVVTFCLSPVCNESTTLNTSAVFRPVLAG